MGVRILLEKQTPGRFGPGVDLFMFETLRVGYYGEVCEAGS